MEEKKIQIVFFLILSMSLLKASFLNAQINRSIIISTDTHPPLLQADDSPGKESGIMTDIVRAAFKTQNVSVRYMAVPAARMVWSLLEGEAVATVGPMGWFKNKNTAHQVNYIPVYPASFHFYYMKKRFPLGFKYKTLKALSVYKIGYMYGGACNWLFEQAGLTIQKVNDRDQNTRKLYRGRIDLLVTESVGGWASIKKLYPEQISEFDMNPQVIMDAPGCIIFKKDQKELMQLFQKGLHVIKTNGIYQQILDQYYFQQRIPERVMQFIK